MISAQKHNLEDGLTRGVELEKRTSSRSAKKEVILHRRKRGWASGFRIGQLNPRWQPAACINESVDAQYVQHAEYVQPSRDRGRHTAGTHLNHCAAFSSYSWVSVG